MSTSDRQCPLCDQRSDAPFCSVHGLPTVDSSFFVVPPEQVTSGMTLGGRYRLDRALGSGGIGTVYSAEQITTGRGVAIKVLHPDRVTRHNLKRFYQEARVISRLVHPNVVQLVDFGVDEQTRTPFLVMELAVGETLSELVAREGPLAEARGAQLLTQLARALLEAHTLGIVHRDLKPENLMISRLRDGEEHLKVLDFGLAKLAGAESGEPLTRPGAVLGSPLYMSPEQARGETADARSDIYALGAVLFFVLTSRPPYWGDKVMDVLEAHITAPVPRLPSRFVSGESPSRTATDLIERLLAKNPDDRLDATTAAKVLGSMARGGDEADLKTMITVPQRRAPIANAPTAKSADRDEAQARLLYGATLQPDETPATPIDPQPATASPSIEEEPRTELKTFVAGPEKVVEPESIEVSRPAPIGRWITLLITFGTLVALGFWLASAPSPPAGPLAEPLPAEPRAVVAPEPPQPVQAEPEPTPVAEPPAREETPRKVSKPKKAKEKARSIPIW